MAQNWSSPVDVLGRHNNKAEAARAVIAPHSGPRPGHLGGADAGSYALWGQDASPSLWRDDRVLATAELTPNFYPAASPAEARKLAHSPLLELPRRQRNREKHDGNQSYEQKIGLLTITAYGSNPIPTLLRQ